MSAQTGYLKRALKADGKGGLYLDCACGNRLPIPIIKGLPMTYVCQCGIEYDSRGWIVKKPEDKPGS